MNYKPGVSRSQVAQEIGGNPNAPTRRRNKAEKAGVWHSELQERRVMKRQRSLPRDHLNYQAIQYDRGEVSIRLMCRCVEVSPSRLDD